MGNAEITTMQAHEAAAPLPRGSTPAERWEKREGALAERRRREPSSDSSLSTASSAPGDGRRSSLSSFSSSSAASGAAAPASPTSIGEESLASFQLLCRLGKGSFGKVYLARYSRDGRLLAVKVQRKDKLQRAGKEAQAMEELATLKRLAAARYQCPFICPLHFAFHSRTHLFLVMEYLPGGELFFHLGRRGRVPESLAKFYACEIVLALGTLHAMNICYRDLKPENIVLDEHGHCLLVDFGLSVCLDAHPVISRGAGTTDYLAPEALNDDPGQGLALDWWSFGVLLYELLVGLPPWHSEEKSEVIDGILHGDVAELDFGDMSAHARALIGACLVREPAKRIGAAGTRQVTSHAFFKSVDWVRVAKRGYEAPFAPPRDACNFEPQPAVKPFTWQPASSRDPFDGYTFWRAS